MGLLDFMFNQPAVRGDRQPIGGMLGPVVDPYDPYSYAGGGLDPANYAGSRVEGGVTVVPKDAAGGNYVAGNWPAALTPNYSPVDDPNSAYNRSLITPQPAAAPDNATLPPNATPASTVPQPPLPPPATSATPTTTAVPETSLLGRIGRGLNENAYTLMLGGAGLASGRGWGSAISGGLQGAAAGSLQDERQRQQNQTYLALKNRGLPDDVALAASGDPKVVQALLPQLFGAKKLQIQKATDPATGREFSVVFNEANPGEIYRLDPRVGLVPMGSSGAQVGARTAVPRPASFEDALRLPVGTRFIDPNGIERIR